MTIPISILIVTEGRRAFWPWLRWNLDQQTIPRERRRLIVSAPAAEQEGLRRVLEGVGVVRFVDRPLVPATLGQLRQQLLDAVEPIIDEPIAWWDDDDWHDPTRLEVGLRELRDVPWVTWTRLAYSDLEGRYLPFDLPTGIPIATMAWHSACATIGFRDGSGPEDTCWFRDLTAFEPGRLLREPAPAMVALKHGRQLNPRRLTLVAQVDPVWWGRVGNQLHDLAQRLRLGV